MSLQTFGCIIFAPQNSKTWSTELNETVLEK